MTIWDHFNDYLFLIEKLSELKGAKVFDLASGEFLFPQEVCKEGQERQEERRRSIICRYNSN